MRTQFSDLFPIPLPRVSWQLPLLGVGVGVFLGLGALAPSAMAQASGAAQSVDTPAATNVAPLHIVGHLRVRQRVIRGDVAWTLGDDGDLIAWQRSDESGWRPTALRRIADASGLVFQGGQLLVLVGTDQLVKVHRTTLAPDASERFAWTGRCGSDALWTVQANGRLCAHYGEETSARCTSTTMTEAPSQAVCTLTGEAACLVLTPSDTTSVACAARSSSSLSVTTVPATNDIATRAGGQLTWWAAQSGQWTAQAASTPREVTYRTNGALTCLHLDGTTLSPCTSMDASEGLDTSPVRVPRLVDVVLDESGIYFVFVDGWMRVQPSFETTTSAFAHLSSQAITSFAERVWTDGEVLDAQSIDGTAHLAVCDAHGGKWTLSDIALHDDKTTLVDRGEGPCPGRADYRADGLVYTRGNTARVFDFATQKSSEVPLETPFYGPVGGTLRAEVKTSRSCANGAWDFNVASERLGLIPIAAQTCASTVTMIRWTSEDHVHEGPGFIVSTSNASTLHLIDENTLQIVGLRVPGAVSRRTRVHRDRDGSWLLVDQERGSALRVQPDLRTVAPEDALILFDRAFSHRGSGVYGDHYGNTLLATDRGILLNGSGFGPVADRTLREDMRPVERDPASLRAAIRTLLQVR